MSIQNNCADGNKYNWKYNTTWRYNKTQYLYTFWFLTVSNNMAETWFVTWVWWFDDRRKAGRSVRLSPNEKLPSFEECCLLGCGNMWSGRSSRIIHGAPICWVEDMLHGVTPQKIVRPPLHTHSKEDTRCNILETTSTAWSSRVV
jgi:hypothetical protein